MEPNRHKNPTVSASLKERRTSSSSLCGSDAAQPYGDLERWVRFPVGNAVWKDNSCVILHSSYSRESTQQSPSAFSCCFCCLARNDFSIWLQTALASYAALTVTWETVFVDPCCCRVLKFWWLQGQWNQFKASEAKFLSISSQRFSWYS